MKSQLIKLSRRLFPLLTDSSSPLSSFEPIYLPVSELNSPIGIQKKREEESEKKKKTA